MSPVEIELKKAEWRRKSVEGTISLEEMKEVVKIVRQGRMHAAETSASAKRVKARAAIPSADELIDEI